MKLIRLLMLACIAIGTAIPSIAQPFAGQICKGCEGHGHYGYVIPTFEEYWAGVPKLDAGPALGSGGGLTMKSGSFNLKIVPSEQSIYNPGDKKFCELAEKASWFGAENHEVWYQTNIGVEIWAMIKFTPDPGSSHQATVYNVHQYLSKDAFVAPQSLDWVSYTAGGIFGGWPFTRAWEDEMWNWKLAAPPLASKFMTFNSVNDFPSDKSSAWFLEVLQHNGSGLPWGKFEIESYAIKFTSVVRGWSYHNIEPFAYIPGIGITSGLPGCYPSTLEKTMVKTAFVDGGYNMMDQSWQPNIVNAVPIDAVWQLRFTMLPWFDPGPWGPWGPSGGAQ